MEFQKFQITKDGRFFLDGFEVNNVKEFEIKNNSLDVPIYYEEKIDCIRNVLAHFIKVSLWESKK